MKRFIKITAAALAAGMAVTLAGCAGCSGCGGSTVNTTVTNSNWYTGTSYKGIQPSFVLSENHPEYTAEKITYSVSFDNALATNKSYSVEYNNGEYTTEFYATYYDWQNSVQEYKTESVKRELVYCYKTNLTISGKYTLTADKSVKEFNDSVVTECYFRSANDNLQPVYSKQVIKSTSPNKRDAKTLDDACKTIDVIYENYYSPECDEVITIVTEAGKEAEKQSPVSLKKVGNTLFDNSSLYIAMRSMKISSSQTVSLYAPAAGGVFNYAVSPASATLGSEERKTVSSALADKGLYSPVTADENGNPVEDAGIKTSALNVNYTGGKLTGTAQTVWYAAIENPDNNTARATMLKISIPLSYNLGTLNFTLKEVNSTLWSD